MGEAPLLTNSLYRVQGSPYTGFMNCEAPGGGREGEMPIDGFLTDVAGLTGEFILPSPFPRRLPFF